jgi:hypothetical protein
MIPAYLIIESNPKSAFYVFSSQSEFIMLESTPKSKHYDIYCKNELYNALYFY